MFEKLLSALPFNPGTVQQLSFYSRRVRSEQSIRRIGLVFIVLAFLVQFFAFISPPQPTLADSPNDLVDGGFSSAPEAAADCSSSLNTSSSNDNYGYILANYGITCSEVANAQTLTINSDDWDMQLWSMGRLPESIAGETTVAIPGLGYPLYARYLWGWDSPGTSSNYQVLNVTTTGGQTFLLMFACGNIVSVGFPQPVQQPPSLTISKTTIPGYPTANNSYPPGTTLGYRIYFSNSGGAATNVDVTDPQPDNTTENYLSPSTATSAGFSNSVASWNFANMPSGASSWYVDVDFQINPGTPNGTQICNTASIKSDQTATINTDQYPVCVYVQASSSLPPAVTPPPTPAQPTKPTRPSAPVCEQQLSSENTSACITVRKSAANLTENIPDANGTTAQAGDLIEYTLSATNNSSSAVKDYVFQDSLAYVLDYSSLINANGGAVTSNEISWPGVDIGPSQTITKQFEVKVDSPIPQTPTSTSDPNYFNLKMSNTFGNTIVINLPSTPVHTLQATSTALPNTGPGNSIIIGAVILAIAGFFFYRSRLLSKETKIVIAEQAGGF